MRIRSLLAAAALVALTGSLGAEPLAVGAAAPEVSGMDQNGKTIALGELYAAGDVLVYFYPKADTKGCTAQACSLRDAYEVLVERGVTVIGVSADTAASQKAFDDKYHLPFTLLADPEHKVINAFGVPLFGPGLATRQAFLIRKGRVVWRDLEAATAEQAAEVLAALDALGETSA